MNYCLMSIMLLYDYCFEISAIKNDFNLFNNILKLNYSNLMLIAEHTLQIISSSGAQLNNIHILYNNFLILKLYNIIEIFRKKGGFKKDFVENNPALIPNELDMPRIEKISYYTNLIVQYARYALKNYKTSKNEKLTIFFKKIKEKSYEEINVFFREQIFQYLRMNQPKV